MEERGSGVPRQKILSLTFNQDNSCLVGGMEGGFFTYNTEPFAQATKRSFENGVGKVELLYRSNILALVGGGSCPQWPPNKVMLWDDTKRKCVGELSFHSAVHGVLMRKDVIVAVLEKRIFVYNFVDLQMKHSFQTLNPKGLCALSMSPHPHHVIAFPDVKEKGHLRVEKFTGQALGEIESSEGTGLVIAAHESDIAAIAINRIGTLVATASTRGTLIRVFCTETGHVRHELRRGADRAVIYSLAFNHASTLLACTSDKSTVHIFPIGNRLSQEEEELSEDEATAPEQVQSVQHTRNAGLLGIFNIAGQAQGMLKDKLGDYLPKYFTTETRRSLVRFPVQETFTICAFGPKPNMIYVAGLDGTFSHFAFDLESGAHERTFFGSVFSNDP